MFLEKFNTREQIQKKIERVESTLDFDTFKNVTRIYYETLKLSFIKLNRKRKLSKKNRNKNVTLGRSEITTAMKLLDYFHKNDCCTPFDEHSPLAGCYYPNISEAEALRFCNAFIVGTIKDRFGFEINFTKDFYLSLYKSDGLSHNVAAQEEKNFNLSRVKRLPMVRFTVETTTNIFQRIDDNENLERMYVHRFIDYFKNTFFVIVIAEKNKKDKTSPFIVKTAFPIFDHLPLLRRIEKYEPPSGIK